MLPSRRGGAPVRDFLLHTYDLLMRGGAAIAGFLRGLHRGGHRACIVLAALMVADYLTGILAAAKGNSPKSGTGRLSSAAGFAGLMKKAAMAGVLLLCCGLDWLIQEGNTMFFTAACWMYISNESLSLLENLALCGVPVPGRLRRMLEKLSNARELTEQ